MALRKNGRATVLAHVAVGLPSHPRMLRIPKGRARGEALGCWLAAICYSRDGELDGWCPVEALEPVSTPETRAKLIEVGLFEASDAHGVAGVIVCRYVEFNETKSEIDARLLADSRRKSLGRVRRDSDRIPKGVPQHLEYISGTGTGTGTGDVSEGGAGGGPDRPVAGTVGLADPMPAVTESILARLEMDLSGGAPLRDLDAHWLAFCGHYDGTLLRGQVPGKWQKWLAKAFRDQLDADARSSMPGAAPGQTTRGVTVLRGFGDKP
jgi:hypothetical protein